MLWQVFFFMYHMEVLAWGNLSYVWLIWWRGLGESEEKSGVELKGPEEKGGEDRSEHKNSSFCLSELSNFQQHEEIKFLRAPYAINSFQFFAIVLFKRHIRLLFFSKLSFFHSFAIEGKNFLREKHRILALFQLFF